MNIPKQTKPALWGFATGAVAVMIVGFNWGGWVTGGTAESTASQRSKDAVVAALAPICVDKFTHATDVVANRAALGKTEAWSRSDFVEKGGWALMPGPVNAERVTAVARACAELLVA